MRAFETVIECNESDSGGRLYYLEQHTSGRAREIVRSCMYLNPGEGYSKAKKLLEARFGQKHNIAMAYVDQLTNLFIYLFIYYFPTIKITQALHYTKMWRGDLRKPQGLYEEAPSLQ